MGAVKQCKSAAQVTQEEVRRGGLIQGGKDNLDLFLVSFKLLLLPGDTKTSPGVGAETEDLEPIQSDLPLVIGHPLHNLKAIVYGATNSGTLIVGEAVDVLTATRTTALP